MQQTELQQTELPQTELPQTELRLDVFQNEPPVLNRQFNSQPDAALSHALQALCQQADSLLEQERWEEAAAAYQQILTQNPELDWGYHGLAVALSQLDRFPEADAVYEQLARLKPMFWAVNRNHIQVQQQLSDYLFRQQNWLQAVKAYRWTIELDPTIAANYLKLGQAFLAIGQRQEAETAFTEAIQRQPDRADASIALSNLHLHPEDRQNSIAVPCDFGSLFSSLRIFVTPALLQTLYAATPKLFVAAADAVAVGTLRLPEDFCFYQFSFDSTTQTGTIASLPAAEQTTAFTDSEKPIELSWAPLFCDGFLIATNEGRSQLQPLINWWRTQTDAAIPPLFDLSAIAQPLEREAELWKRLYRQAAAETAQLGSRLTLLQKQYLDLRSLHETVQNAFAAIESFLSQAKLPALQLAFETHPTRHHLTPAPGTDSSPVQQLLPLPSQGLAAIEFHIAVTQPHAEGTLRVAVYSPDDATELACWQIPYAHLTQGWFQLDLPGIDLGRKRDVYLQLDWKTRLGPAPAISLGDLQSVPEARAQMPGQTIDRSLALRLWRGLPGSRRSYSPYLTLNLMLSDTANPPAESRSGDLGQLAMGRVVEVTPNLPTDDLAYIRVLENGRKILTHARRTGVTVAMLPFGFAAGGTQIRATVETQDEKAGAIEYAMALVRDSDAALLCFSENPAAAIAFSGWTSIAPNTAHQLSVTLPEPLNEPCHIVFGTRTPVGGSNAYGWACWLNFHVTCPS